MSIALSDSVRKLMEKGTVVRISVIDANGYPHTVPIWFVRDVDDVVFFSSRDARKIGYISNNSKGSISIGGDPYGSEGYLLKGEFSVEEDQQNRWLREITFRYEPPELAEKHVSEWAGPDIVVMRFKTNKIVKV
jgi:nitroimidazol reductase NimA-like FMN-containing flavoprotein (pyridoxamine 5'-phosphate oxidase superfamily)